MSIRRYSLLRLTIVVAVAALVRGSSAVAVQPQQPDPQPAALLVVDQFTGFDPNTELGRTRQNLYDTVTQRVADYLSEFDDPANAESLTALMDALASEAPELGAGLTEGDTCATHLPEFGVDGTGNYVIGGAGPAALHPHGEIVNAAILNAVEAYAPAKLSIPSTAVPEDYFIEALDTGLGAIHGIEVIHVDVQSYNLDVINQQIAGYLDGSTRPDLAGIPWIVNASFAVVPCSEIATLEAYTDALFALDALIDDANPAKIAVFQHVVKKVTERVRTATEDGGNLCGAFVDGPNVFVNPDTESPSCGYLKELISQASVFVAAAGNAGLSYPFYPASEPAVVSVSATAEDVPFLAFSKALNCVTDSDGNPLCSNWGEVLMPGQVTYQGQSYFGTSFAAPRLSLRLAVYMARYGANECELMTEPFNNVLLRQLPYVTLTSIGRSCSELNQVRWNIFKD